MTTEIVTAYRLTPMQQLMLAHGIGEPSSDACFVQYSLRITGSFDPERYRAAWQSLVDRHDVLRTAFAWQGLAEPLQAVLSHATVPLARVDLSDVDDVDARVTELAVADSRAGFDLTTPPLLRLTAIRLPQGTWHVLVGMHHLVVDGWSVEQLLREVAATYRGEPPTGPVAQFGDYVAWLADRRTDEAEAYWRHALGGLAAGAGRPGALRRACPVRTGELRESRRELGEEIVAGLRERARSHRVTLATLVRGVWGLLLARYAGTPEAVFAVTLAGRPAELDDVSGIVGPFLNNLPVRVSGATDDLPGLLAELQREQGRMDQHQWCSPVQLAAWAGQDSTRPMCETMLVFQNYPGEERLPALAHGTHVERWRPASPTVRTGFPLTLTVTAADTLGLRTTVDRGVISQPGVRRLEHDLCTMLTALAAGSDHLPLPPPWQPPAEDERRKRQVTTAYREPETELQRRIVQIFTDVLEVDQVGVDDDFFAAGGNSLAAIHLSWRLREELDREVRVEAVFTNRTPSALTDALETAHASAPTT